MLKLFIKRVRDDEQLAFLLGGALPCLILLGGLTLSEMMK